MTVFWILPCFNLKSKLSLPTSQIAAGFATP